MASPSKPANHFAVRSERLASIETDYLILIGAEACVVIAWFIAAAIIVERFA